MGGGRTSSRKDAHTHAHAAVTQSAPAKSRSLTRTERLGGALYQLKMLTKIRDTLLAEVADYTQHGGSVTEEECGAMYRSSIDQLHDLHGTHTAGAKDEVNGERAVWVGVGWMGW